MKRLDWLIIAVILAAALFAAVLLLPGDQGASAEIQSPSGVQTVSLREDRDILLYGEGGYNRVVIENGTIRVADADCPDGVCVHRGRISRGGESVTCLPHRVMIRVLLPTKDVDTVAQ